MKKRIFSMFLCLCMVFTLMEAILPTAAASSLAPGIDIDSFNALLSSFQMTKYPKDSLYVDNPSLYGGYECFGFANELACYIFGSYPTNSMSAKPGSVNSDWKITRGGESVKVSFAVGDIVRYGNHSIFITETKGNAISYCDANVPDKSRLVNYNRSATRDKLQTLVNQKLTDIDAYGWVAHNTKGLKPLENLPSPKNLGDDFYAYIYNPHSDRNVENHMFNVQLATKNTSDPRQIWHFIRQKDGSYSIINKYEKSEYETIDYYLDVSNGTYAAGVNIQVMTGGDPNNKAQKWLVCGDDGVNFYFTPMINSSHRCVMDVANAGTAAGTNIGLSLNTYGEVGYRDEGSPISWAQTFQIQIIKTSGKKKESIAAPTGVSAKWKSTGSNAAAELTWKNVSKADNYEVAYKKDGGNWETVPFCIMSPNTSHVFDNLDSSLSYSLRVRALKSNGKSNDKSNILSDWVEYTLPAKPAESTKLAGPGGVSGVWTSTGPEWKAKISWNAVSGATYYNVQYRTPKTNNQWKKDTDYSSGTSYISTGLKDYPYYEYRIQAGNADGKSDWVCYALKKPDVVTPPAKPENVSVNWTSNGLVPKICPRVSWGAVSGAEHYEVQYKKAAANSWSAAVTVKSQTAHTFSELDIDTAYVFRVKAVNAGGSSAWSECNLPSLITIKETVDPPPTVAAPTGVSGTWISTGPEWKAKISWNAVSGATSYEVQYRTPKTGNAWKADPDYSSGTSYISSGLKDYDSYDYRVRAVNAGGASNWTKYKLEKNASAPPAPGSSHKYIQQADNDGCYIASAAMVISNYRLQNGGSAITYAEAKAANGNSTFFNWGTFSKYGLKDVDLWTSANSGLSGSARAQMVNTALGKNNYGAMLCFKGNGKSHAVVIIGYENGNILVNDPARYGEGGERIKLTDCKYIRDNITGYVSQEQMLTYANSLTYFVANGSLGSNTEKNPPIETPQPPSAPSGVSGTWTSTGSKWQARISWNAVSGATRYEVQYRTPKTGNAWKTDADYSSGTSYISTGLADYSSYDYRIRACNAAGASGWTEYTLVKTTGSTNPAPASTVTEPAVTVPSAPNGVSGTWTSTGPKWQARISWAAVSGATSYEVQYRTPKTGNAWKTDPDYSSGTSYISTGLLDYNSYDYRVRACNSAGASAWTTYTLVKPVSAPPAQTTPAPAPAAPTPTPPSAPSGVSGSWTSTGPQWQARISWNAVSGATYYEVQYRTPKTGNEWRSDPDYSSGTSYISTGLLDYNSYDYRVRACNSAGASAWTTYTLVKPTPTTPSAPTGVSGSWTSRGPTWQARISWAAVSGATYYEVQYRTPKTGNAWRADPDYSSGTSYISTGLMDYSSYDYRVRAVNAAGASAWTEYTLYK